MTTAASGHVIAGRYVLRSPIASGGMARVWEADDTVLDRKVAVKILHPHLADDPSFVDRFRSEARAAARLSHQSIVAIYDTASETGLEAIVMELIDGITLRQYLDDFGALSLEDATDLTTQVAEALDAAHDARLVHRDIKPGNIILCPDRRIKVTDFGIAKALEVTDQTAAGTMLGTAKYLAPEQVEGTPVDARADVYSLGIVLYEALTGRAPFDEDSSAATALARLRVEPDPPRRHRPDIPYAVEQVVLRAMSRDRDARYASAGAFREALVAAMTEPSVADPTTSGPVAVIDPTVSGPMPILDPTTVVDSPAQASHPPRRAKPETTSPGDARSADRRLSGRALLVVLIVAGSLALGLGLILATTVGRDFFDRARDTLAGDENASTGGDRPGGSGNAAEPAPAGEGDTDVGGAIVDAADDRAAGSGGPRIVDVVDFDPLGDGEEGPERTALAIDGDPSTAWTSEEYSNRALGNLKPGVGLVILLENRSTLRELAVVSSTRGWAGEVYAADAPAASLEDWGEPLDGRSGIEGDSTFDLRGVRATAVLIWITDLGDAPPRLRIEIAEITVS